MPARLFRVILMVSDIERAARFYAAMLEKPGQRVSPGRHYFDCGGTILACVDPDREGDMEPPRANADFFYFSFPDLEDALRRCLAGGARPAPGEIHNAPAGEIVQRPWGERSVYLRDPFENLICLVDEKTVFTGG